MRDEIDLMFPKILAILAREGETGPKGVLLPPREGSRGWSLAGFQMLSHREKENKKGKKIFYRPTAFWQRLQSIITLAVFGAI